MFKTGPSESITLQILEKTPWCLAREEGMGRKCLVLHLGHLCLLRITHILSSISFLFIHFHRIALSPSSWEAGLLAGPPSEFFLPAALHAKLHLLPTPFLLVGTQTLLAPWLHLLSLLPTLTCWAFQLSPLTSPSHFHKLVLLSLLNIFEHFWTHLLKMEENN